HWPSICVVLLVATAPLSAPHSFPTRRSSDLTAGGVVFMTLEDETGFVNVVVWESVFDRYSLLAKTVNFLGITGTLQVEDGIVHLDRKSTRLNSSHEWISYAVFRLKKKSNDLH